jgi:ornithine decarboxylase
MQLNSSLEKRLIGNYTTPLCLFSKQFFQRNYQILQQSLPYLKHHYAIKSLPVIEAVESILELNGYFDVATNGEIELLKLANVAPEHCIHTHPIKKITDIEYALEYGINHFVVDNPAEILKFRTFRDRVRLILRVAFSNKFAQFDLSAKFGCERSDCLDLVDLALQNGLHVSGISFHVGSQMSTSLIHQQAIEWANSFYLELESRGMDLDILDIGGGFPAQYKADDISLVDFCEEIKPALDKFHSNFPECTIVSEPGRCISASTVSLITQIIGKKYKHGQPWYYIDDGVYGSFSANIFDHRQFSVEPLEHITGEYISSVVAGPTCDSIDIIDRNAMLPEMEIGDYLITHNIGAYSLASCTDFNFVPRAKLVADCSNNFSLPAPAIV